MRYDSGSIVIATFAIVAVIWGLVNGFAHQNLSEQLDAIQTAIAATPVAQR